MKIITLVTFMISITLNTHANPDFMICNNLSGYDNNEVNCIKSSNTIQAKREFRRREIMKRDLEKMYSKKLYPREHATSFLPQE